jgi:hypothetical protein
MDTNRDGYLSEEEFGLFVRKLNLLLKEKRYFWRLLMQLLIQKDVQAQFFNAFPETDSLIHPGHVPGDNLFPSRMLKLITDYFVNKKSRMGTDYDPETDFELFILSLKGFAISVIFSDETDDEKNERTISRIIELYK